jgi:hypothetical protein
MRIATLHHLLRVVMEGRLTNRSCSEVFVFGAYSTETIPGELSGTVTQYTGGRFAYNVVEDAS